MNFDNAVEDVTMAIEQQLSCTMEGDEFVVDQHHLHFSNPLGYSIDDFGEIASDYVAGNRAVGAVHAMPSEWKRGYVQVVIFMR